MLEFGVLNLTEIESIDCIHPDLMGNHSVITMKSGRILRTEMDTADLFDLLGD